MTPAPPTDGSAAAQGAPPELAPMPRLRRGWRVFIFYSSAVLLTGVARLALRRFDLAHGVVAFGRWCCWGLFTVLFLLIAIGCMHGVFGFVLRLSGDRRITRLKDYRGPKHPGRQHGAGFSHPQRASPPRLRGPARHLPVPAKNRPAGPVRFLHPERFLRSGQMG